MPALILQIQKVKSLEKSIEDKSFNLNNPLTTTRDKVLISFKDWIDSLILSVIKNSNVTYPYENRVGEITEIDYNNRDELYNFFTSFLDSFSLQYLNPFITSLIDTVYNWPNMIVDIVNSAYEGTLCTFSGKTKFCINYPKLKLSSSLLFYVK